MLTLSNKLCIQIQFGFIFLLLIAAVNGKVTLKPTQQQQSTSTLHQLTTVKPFVGIGPWVKHEIITTESPSTSTVSPQHAKPNNNQYLHLSSFARFSEANKSLRSNQKPSISARSSNPLNNNVRSLSTSSQVPSVQSSSLPPVEYGFTDKDYPYVIVKSSHVDSSSSSPDYRNDYDDESSSGPTSTPSPHPSSTQFSTSNSPSKARKVLRCRTADGRSLSDEQCSQKLAQMAQQRSAIASSSSNSRLSRLGYLDQPTYSVNNANNKNDNNQGNSNGESVVPQMSSKLGNAEEGRNEREKSYEDEYEAKEDEKWTRGVREWDRDEYPSSTTAKSMERVFGARSGRSSAQPSSPSSSPKRQATSNDEPESSGDQLGISYSADTGNTEEDKYYSQPDYNYRESGPIKKSKNPYEGSSSSQRYKSRSSSTSSSSSSSSSSSPSSSNKPQSENYDDYSDGQSGTSEGPSSDTEEPSYHSEDSEGYSKSLNKKADKTPKKQSSEPSYNYRGRDEYLTSKSYKSSNPSSDGEPATYYKPSQGYDDYAGEGRSQGDDEKHHDHEDSPSDEKQKKGKSTYEKSTEYKADESYDENDDDGSVVPDYNYNGKSGKEDNQSYDDKPRKNRSNEEEEFDAAFKEPLTGSGHNFHQQESRNIGNFVNGQKHSKSNDSARLIAPSSSSSRSTIPLYSSPSPSPSSSASSSSQASFKANSRSFIKPKNSGKTVLSASMMVD